MLYTYLITPMDDNIMENLQEIQEIYNSASWLVNTLPFGVNEQHHQNAISAKKSLEKAMKKIDEDFSNENYKNLKSLLESVNAWIMSPGVNST